jgi:hypothetical protein
MKRPERTSKLPETLDVAQLARVRGGNTEPPGYTATDDLWKWRCNR